MYTRSTVSSRKTSSQPNEIVWILRFYTHILDTSLGYLRFSSWPFFLQYYVLCMYIHTYIWMEPLVSFGRNSDKSSATKLRLPGKVSIAMYCRISRCTRLNSYFCKRGCGGKLFWEKTVVVFLALSVTKAVAFSHFMFGSH